MFNLFIYNNLMFCTVYFFTRMRETLHYFKLQIYDKYF